MNKLTRLNKLKSLMKIQEQEILIEFKEAQLMNNSIRENISDLENHKCNSVEKLLNHDILMNDFNIVRSFNYKVESAVEELKSQLEVSDKLYATIAEKLKEAKKKSKSIEKLILKEESITNYEEENRQQRQVDENITFSNQVAE